MATKEEFAGAWQAQQQAVWQFMQGLSAVSWQEVVERHGGAAQTALITVDVIKGFCSQGAMASPRVKAIVPNVVKAVQQAGASGVDKFLFTCDSHQHDSAEFSVWPTHCLAGSAESELEDDLLRLPQAKNFKIIPKPSIPSLLNTDLTEQLLAYQDLRLLVLMGDVTDLCLYQLASGLQYYKFAVPQARQWHLLIPENCIQTYDTAPQLAEKLGIPVHCGDFFHSVFLYHLHLLGIEVVKQIV